MATPTMKKGFDAARQTIQADRERLQGRVLVEAWLLLLLQKDRVSSLAVHRRPLEPALLLLPPPLPPPLVVVAVEEEEEVASWSSPPQSRS